MTPLATYRLQLRNAMTFEGAAALAPYLAGLGISHLYLSPIFEAVQGSTHGYDVVDNGLIAGELGGEAGFRAMARSLRAHGIGIILDFVPNHMGASPFNPWWRDVLEWGAAADHAQHFDIDWSAAKLIVPVLAQGYGVVLERGGFGLAFDARDGGISFTYGDLRLPLTPPSYAQIVARVEENGFSDLARRFAVATSETAPELKSELAAMARQPDTATAVLHAIDAVEADLPALHALHELQAWRLTHWRAARETLTYRRFFEIADLVGLKVERPRVFDDVHARVLDLARDASIDGMRLDHIDGLADPRGYLERLQAAVGGQEPAYVVVEKILGPGEALPGDWPVAGTTGYEFIRALAGLLVDPRGAEAMTHSYHHFIGYSVDYEALVRDAKRRILTRNLAGELEVLKEIARTLAARDLATRDLGADTLRRAIIELATALPVYRTYVGISGPHETDRSILDVAARDAKATREVEDEEAIDFVRRLVAIVFAAPEDQATAYDFAVRFQQTTGPVMAKAVEDTAFYRYNRLIALNEVGGESCTFGGSIEDLHDAMAERRERQPAGLSATSTHDTKRGEDARARLYVLSEMPHAWASATSRWAERNAPHRSDVNGATAPDADTEWLFYQSLLGAWPLELGLGDAAALSAFADRMSEFLLKAAREAKVFTSWTVPDVGYEAAVEQFVRAALDPSCASAFLADFLAACQPIFVAGALNGLTQTLVKLAAPGVADIYQGAELWDFNLVDPDNRRQVDFAHRSRICKEVDRCGMGPLVGDWRSGAIKLHLLRSGLRLRRDRRDLFFVGSYLPLEVSGCLCDHVAAFARVWDREAVLIVAPRLSLMLLDAADVPMIPPSRWEDTIVKLPRELAHRRWLNACTGEVIDATDRIGLVSLLDTFPVGLMASSGTGEA